MNILKPKSELLRIYPISHFVPGRPDAPLEIMLPFYRLKFTSQPFYARKYVHAGGDNMHFLPT